MPVNHFSVTAAPFLTAVYDMLEVSTVAWLATR
jgi:hypothetical protein